MQRQSASALRASLEGRQFVKSWEALRLKVYDDGSGYQTVGWGHRTSLANGSPITKAYAENLFMEDMRQAEGVVRLFIRVPLAIHEFDALASFAFNVGGRQFGQSTLRRVLNELDYQEAGYEFLKWTRSGGREVRGLVRRRNAEHRMFLEGRYLDNA